MAGRKRSRNPVWGGLRAGVCRLSRKRCSARWPTEWPRQARFPVAARDLTLPPGANVTTRRGRIVAASPVFGFRPGRAGCLLLAFRGGGSERLVSTCFRNESSVPAFRWLLPRVLPVTMRVSLRQESFVSSLWRGDKAKTMNCSHPRCRAVAFAMTSCSLTRSRPRTSDEDPRATFPRAISAAAVEATCDSADIACRAARLIWITN